MGDEDKLNWDDSIPNKQTNTTRLRTQFCQDLLEINDVKFKICLKLKNATGEAIVIIFSSNGSSNANGACAFIRWKLSNV